MSRGVSEWVVCVCLRGGRALRDNLRIGHIERRVSVGILDSSVEALRLVFECPVLSEGRRHWRYRCGGKRGRRGEDSSPAAALGSEGERESSSEKHACEAGVQRRTDFHEGSAAVVFYFRLFSFFGFGARIPFCIHRPLATQKTAESSYGNVRKSHIDRVPTGPKRK